MRVYKDWDLVISALPPNLTTSQAASLLNRNYTTVRSNLHRHQYSTRDGRHHRYVFRPPVSRVNWSTINWRLSNIAIARQRGVSREIVRRMRKRLGKPFVESRGAKPKKGTNHARKSTQKSS